MLVLNYLSLSVNANVSDCSTDKIILKNKAVQKLETPKPSTRFEQSIIIAAFITNKNNPNVINVTGNVSSTSIGFTNKFNNPKTMATTIEVIKLSTVTPGIKFAISITKIAVTKILINRLIDFLFFVSFKCKKIIIKAEAFISKINTLQLINLLFLKS